MANVYVSETQLQQLKVFNKLRRSGAMPQDRLKQHKKTWWSQVRGTLPGHLRRERLKVGMTTGVLKFARTGQPVQV